MKNRVVVIEEFVEMSLNPAEFRPAQAENMLAVYRIRRQPMPTLSAASAGFFV